ncbi:MAG: hypothetical protein KA190_12430 [Kofleriaceae bacterium]|nr:hypothetical protein [Kofleriaceae bacterium]
MRARFVIGGAVGLALGVLASRPPAIVIHTEAPRCAPAACPAVAAEVQAARVVTISRQAVLPRVSPRLVATALGLQPGNRVVTLDRRPAKLADVVDRWATSAVGASMRIDLADGGQVVVLVEP